MTTKPKPVGNKLCGFAVHSLSISHSYTLPKPQPAVSPAETTRRPPQLHSLVWWPCGSQSSNYFERIPGLSFSFFLSCFACLFSFWVLTGFFLPSFFSFWPLLIISSPLMIISRQQRRPALYLRILPRKVTSSTHTYASAGTEWMNDQLVTSASRLL